MRKLLNSNKANKQVNDPLGKMGVTETFKDLDDFLLSNDTENGTKQNIFSKWDDENSFNESSDIQESMSNEVEINIKRRETTRRKRYNRKLRSML